MLWRHIIHVLVHVCLKNAFECRCLLLSEQQGLWYDIVFVVRHKHIYDTSGHVYKQVCIMSLLLSMLIIEEVCNSFQNW